MTSYKANQVISVKHLHAWQTTYNGLLFVKEDGPEASKYYLDQGYLWLGSQEISFTVRADFNEVADKIAALEAKKAETIKTFNETIGKITAEITKLQAIELSEPTETVVLDQWYFTFGGNHEHPNGYVVIAGTYEGAREQMVKHFGDKWAFQYSSKDFGQKASVYGLHEVKLPEDDGPKPAQGGINDDIPF